MTDQRRPARPTSTPRAAGVPNVLSDQATPNQLSTMGTGGAPYALSATKRPVLASPTQTRSTQASGRAPAPADDRLDTPRRRVRAPSLGAIIFLAILLFNAARLFGVGGGAA